MEIGNVVSLFDGISCGQLALNKCGIKFGDYYASEVDKSAISVANHNYKDTIQLGDVKLLSKRDFPEVDLLIGGSPCQNFSVASKNRTGLDGEKSSLFFEYLRLLRELKPRYFLLENVIMKSSDYFYVSKELGTEPVRINSSLVSGQSRDRYYWTNIGREGSNLFGFRKSEIQQPKNRGILMQSILTNGYTDKKKGRCLLESDSRPLADMSRAYFRYMENGFGNLVFKDIDYYIDLKKRYMAYIGAKKIDTLLDDKRLSLYGKKGVPKTPTGKRILTIEEGAVRHLNQIELERLQTLPEGYISIVSRNKAAGLIGNAWNVDTVAHIFSFLNS